MRKLVALLTVALLMLIASLPVLAQEEAEEEAPSGMARFRVVQTTSLPTAVVFRDDNNEDETPAAAILSGLRQGSATRWIEVPAGTYWFYIGANSTLANAAYGPVEVTLNGGDFVTLAPTGQDDITVINQDYSPIAANNARITLFHGLEGGDTVDVWAGEELVVNALAFPGTFYTPAGPLNDGLYVTEVPAGTIDFTVVPNGLTEPVLVDLTATEIEEGVNYFIAITGAADAPEAVVVATRRSDYLASLVDLASGNDDLSMLVDVLGAADPSVLETLMGNGPFTVFAPNNAAFEALLEELGMSAEELTENTDLLTQVLEYHVVGAAGGGELRSDELTDGRAVLTLNGDFIDVTVGEDGTVMLNDAVSVIAADMEGLNGIVHVIDGVLVPELDMEEPAATEDADAEDTEDADEEDAEATEEATEEDEEGDEEDAEATEEADEEDED